MKQNSQILGMVGGAPRRQGLYDPRNEHDSCGVGFIVNIKGRKSHAIIEDGLRILANLTHRGAVGADPKAGDGAGILIQIPDGFFRAECTALGFELPAVGDYGVGMFFLPPDHERQVCFREEAQRGGRTIVKVRARAHESLSSVVDKTDIDSGRHHRETQFFRTGALKGIVERERMPENRPRHE